MSYKQYESLQLNLISDDELHSIELDVPRTSPEVPYFSDKEGHGQLALKKILVALSNHPCSIGYTQGLNFIVAAIQFHCGEVLAFEMTVRILNDYQLNECHMDKLPGLTYHSKIINILLK